MGVFFFLCESAGKDYYYYYYYYWSFQTRFQEPEMTLLNLWA